MPNIRCMVPECSVGSVSLFTGDGFVGRGALIAECGECGQVWIVSNKGKRNGMIYSIPA